MTTGTPARLKERLRLPGLHVVTVHLLVADRLAEGGGGPTRDRVLVADSEQGDLGAEQHEGCHDRPPLVHVPLRAGTAPALCEVRAGAGHGLAVTGGGHDRLDDAGETDLLRTVPPLFEAAGAHVGAGGGPRSSAAGCRTQRPADGWWRWAERLGVWVPVEQGLWGRGRGAAWTSGHLGVRCFVYADQGPGPRRAAAPAV